VPYDDLRRAGEQLAAELDDLVATTSGQCDDHAVEAAVVWAATRLREGSAPTELRDAALRTCLRAAEACPERSLPAEVAAIGARRSTPVIAPVPDGADAAALDDSIDTHAGAIDELATRGAQLAAVQCVAAAVTWRRGLVDAEHPPDGSAARNSDAAGESDAARDSDDTAWIDLDEPDPVGQFMDGALRAELAAADARWRAAARSDPEAALDALVSIAASGYHHDEHTMRLSAHLRRWADGLARDEPPDPMVFTVAARHASRRAEDATARDRRLRAEAMAFDALDLAPADLGRVPRGGHGLVTSVGTGLARTPTETRAALLHASLDGGLSPEDLVEAVALLAACAYAGTSFDDDESGRADRAAAMGSCTGALALAHHLERTHSPGLRYELALCSIHSPGARCTEPAFELWVPPSDDAGLEDLRAALVDGDPDAAADAATAVSLDDAASADAAWSAVIATAARDQWHGVGTLEHVEAAHRACTSTDHPARIWYLAAAARSAAYGAAAPQPLAVLAEMHLR
jgi:hypothetical protein